MAAKTRYCRDITIFLSDWFRERAVVLRKNVSKFSWKSFKSPFNIIKQINMF